MFIHDAILESVTCGDTQIAAINLKDSITKMKKHDSKNKPHGFKYQFKVYLLQHTCTQVYVVWGRHTHLSSCRFWSRFLPTLKRFTVVEP